MAWLESENEVLWNLQPFSFMKQAVIDLEDIQALRITGGKLIDKLLITYVLQQFSGKYTTLYGHSTVPYHIYGSNM